MQYLFAIFCKSILHPLLISGKPQNHDARTTTTASNIKIEPTTATTTKPIYAITTSRGPTNTTTTTITTATITTIRWYYSASIASASTTIIHGSSCDRARYSIATRIRSKIKIHCSTRSARTTSASAIETVE